MSKVKVREVTFTDKEIDLEYPIYLYYQVGSSIEYKMVTEKHSTSVVYFSEGVYLKKDERGAILTESEFKNLSTEEEFRQALNDVVTNFNILL